ncbi:hypothetical protein [Duganella sp. Root1480D1]|uniref:hypothetical protein n=1 Tax=Duganella sp. Root1480D1 TaxID=1736471 RepID=UPI00070A6B7B|nr:hypothetical protein [Duganella sp. Root1480D1]KQZ40571.1 hypothetical protein ASD58_27250 [Duganella sp. Root1480D1]
MADSLQITCDASVVGDDGKMYLHESMFSGLFDLPNNHAEIVARIHPAKRKLFDALIAGELVETETKDQTGATVRIPVDNDIMVHVNQRYGGVRRFAYSTIIAKHARTYGEVQARGFDSNCEPVIRQMPDRSFRIIFNTMPPRGHALGAAFNMDHFGASMTKLTESKMTWDDRDVFHLPSATEAEIRAILQFLLSYGKA